MVHSLYVYAYLALFVVVLVPSLQNDSFVGANDLQTCNDDNDDPSLLNNDDDAILIDELVEWIRQEGGIVDDRQQVVERKDDSFAPFNVVATSFIPKDTLLLSVPWNLVLEPKDYPNNNEDDLFCEVVHVLHNEMKNDEEDRFGRPFVDFLRTLTRQPPSGWSYGARTLLTEMMGQYLQQWTKEEEPEVNLALETWKQRCKPDKDEFQDVKEAALLVWNYKSPNPMEEDQGWYHLVPFYNFYSFRENASNTRFVQDNDEHEMEVIAARDIYKGESIYTPMSYGDLQDGDERRFIHSGLLERRHWYTFVEPSAGMYQKLDVKFDLDLVEDSDGGTVYKVTWVDGVRPHSRSYDYIEKELKRLGHYEELLNDDSLYLLHPTTSYERKAIRAYTMHLMNALLALLKTRHDPRPVTAWTQLNFTVAGVNLGSYNLAGVEQDTAAETTQEEPFELFENFDLSDKIIGNENWLDMIEYRRQMDQPSLCFYVDKVARKRWLPTQGMPQAQQFVLNYGFELTETGVQQDEAEALVQCIPDQVDYAAKPSHHSMGVSVWLVSHDTENNITSFSNTARQLMVDEKRKFDKVNVAKGLAEHLHAEATDKESLTLRRVKPGVVVEERFVQVDHFDRAPIEFCLFVIWGRLWVAQVNYIQGNQFYTKTWLYRDGSPVNGRKELPFDYVDWPRLVRIAETLGANKDMFRVDVFVGIPASSPTLQANRTREERLAAVEYVVNEGEIYPTSNFKRLKQLAQDGARLWVAGYKMGNYRMIPNDEVPKEFIEKGSLSEMMLDLTSQDASVCVECS